jgi:hypothetical protein
MNTETRIAGYTGIIACVLMFAKIVLASGVIHGITAHNVYVVLRLLPLEIIMFVAFGALLVDPISKTYYKHKGGI